MDEMKNENITEEPVVEQRPSTKYGRTAYQQQMQQEEAAQGQQIPPQQNGYQYWEGGANPYQQNQNTYNQSSYQQYNTYSTYQEPVAEVKNIYAYILMALVAVSGIISAIVNMLLSEAFTVGNTLEEVVDEIFVVAAQPGVSTLSSIGNLLSWITIGLLIFDIMQLRKAGKKITGAILFAIFLRPAYVIWRAHLLGQKKMGAIIFTVVFYIFSFIQTLVFMSAYLEMVMRIAVEMGIY